MAVAKPLGGKAASLQAWTLSGWESHNHFILLCEGLPLPSAPPDPHTTFLPEQWCRRKVSSCGAWVITLGNSVLDSRVRWPETYDSVDLGQQHPQVSLAGFFFEVRALPSEFCGKGREAPGPGGQYSG